MLSSVSPRANSISGHRANRPQGLLQCLPPSAKRSERRGQKSQKWAESQKWDLKSQKRQQRGLPRVVPEGKRFTRLARAKNGTKNRVIPGDLALPWPSTQGCLGCHKSTSTSHFSLVLVAKSESGASQRLGYVINLGKCKKSKLKDTQAIQPVSPISDQHNAANHPLLQACCPPLIFKTPLNSGYMGWSASNKSRDGIGWLLRRYAQVF